MKRKKEFTMVSLRKTVEETVIKTKRKTTKKKKEVVEETTIPVNIPEEEEEKQEKKEKAKKFEALMTKDLPGVDYDFILGKAQTNGLAKPMLAGDYIDYLLGRDKTTRTKEEKEDV